MAVQLGLSSTATMFITSEERMFFGTTGERIASLHKAKNVTQAQLTAVCPSV